MMKIMNTQAICRYWFVCLGLLALGACSKQDQPAREEQANAAHTTISLFSELLPDEVDRGAEEGLRALDFDLMPNKNGHDHPSVALTHAEGKTLSAVLLFHNTETGARFLQENVSFTYNAEQKSFQIKDLTLDNAPENMSTAEPDKWKVLCLVGGRYSNGKLYFEPQMALNPSEVGRTIALDAIYMSKAWQPLSYSWDATARKGRLSLSAQAGQTAKIQLRNQCMTLMCRISPNALGAPAKVQGFRIATSGLSFRGVYDFDALSDQNPMPRYTHTPSYNGGNFWVATPETVAVGSRSKYYACVAMPTSATSNLRIAPIVGDTRASAVETKYTDYLDKAVTSSTYVGINNLASGPKTLEHPIEAFFTAGYESREIHRDGPGKASDMVNAGAYTKEAGLYRAYKVPTIYQLAVLLPSMKGGYSRTGAALAGNLSRGILDYRQGYYHDTTKTGQDGSDHSDIEKEKIFVWGNGDGYTEFDAVYEHHGRHKQNVASFGNTYYGIRFKGHGNKYLSAYKFERKGNNMEVTVRTLGPSRSSTTIGQVKDPNFWTKPLEWDQRQWTRTISQGRYWSTNTEKRNTLGGTNVTGAFAKTVYDTMKVFLTTAQDGNVAQPDAAFVTSGKNRPSHLEDPKAAKNNDNNYYVFFTTDQDGRPIPPTP